MVAELEFAGLPTLPASVIPISCRSGKVPQSGTGLTGIPNSLRFILYKCNGGGPLRGG